MSATVFEFFPKRKLAKYEITKFKKVAKEMTKEGVDNFYIDFIVYNGPEGGPERYWVEMRNWGYPYDMQHLDEFIDRAGIPFSWLGEFAKKLEG